MRPETKKLDSYSQPKYVVQVGDYHGVILIDYARNKNYESYIDLTLQKDGKFFVTFFAEMDYNENFTFVKSKFGYFDEASINPKYFIRNTPLYEIYEKFNSSMPIKIEIFFDLVRRTLREIYKITEELEYFVVPDIEIKKYYEQDKDEADLITYEKIIDYFYVSKSVFNCYANKSETLIIDDYNFQEFPQFMLSFNWVKKLELYELLISEIPEELTNLINLKCLSLKLKFLTKLPISLPRMENLEVLILERPALNELPKSLFKLTNLKELHIIDNKGISYLPDEISQLTNLEYLYIYSTKIKELPKTISRLIKLKVLYLSDNNIEELPAELTALPELKVLNLSYNKLKKIPFDLFEMESIKEVNLSHNSMLNTDEVYNLLMKSGKINTLNVVL